MSLKEQVREILQDFENISSEKFLEILDQIKPHFKNDMIPDYLQGKIQKISDAENEAEKKKQCQGFDPILGLVFARVVILV